MQLKDHLLDSVEVKKFDFMAPIYVKVNYFDDACMHEGILVRYR